jgi:hypothetical protein
MTRTTRTTRTGTTGIQRKDANERRTTTGTGTRKGRTATARTTTTTTTTTTWSPTTTPTIDEPSTRPHRCEQLLAGWTTGATDDREDGMRKWATTARITKRCEQQGRAAACSGGSVLRTTTRGKERGGRRMRQGKG